MPESGFIDIEVMKQSPTFRKKRYIDAVYFGETLELKRHGKGVMKYKSGRVYEGEWQNDVRHGKGYEKYQNGNVYLGDFENGKAHGKGHYTWQSLQQVYDG